MDFNKIKKIKELKNNFNLFDYYKAQLGIFNNYESTLKLSEIQKEELSKELCIKEIFNVEKRMIVFFSFKIKLNQETLIIENIFNEEICYLNLSENIELKKNNNNTIEIKTGDFTKILNNIKSPKNNISVNGNNKKTIEDGVKFELIPHEDYLCDMLYHLLNAIIYCFVFKKQHYTI